MINQCTFIGRIGAQPVINTFNDGTKVAQFNIACDEPGYINKSGKSVEKRTEWIPVVLWRSLAEVAEKYLKKGSLIYISGKLRTRSYDKDGQKHFRTEIYADTIKMLDSKKEDSPVLSNPEETIQVTPQQTFSQNNDDLPF